ncbi:hypothetical protein [Bacillus phage BC-T25]|nr:hypothetical protein [Bacillus phage BC-T25]
MTELSMKDLLLMALFGDEEEKREARREAQRRQEEEEHEEEEEDEEEHEHINDSLSSRERAMREAGHREADFL